MLHKGRIGRRIMSVLWFEDNRPCYSVIKFYIIYNGLDPEDPDDHLDLGLMLQNFVVIIIDYITATP